jgi:hypothetical protein
MHKLKCTIKNNNKTNFIPTSLAYCLKGTVGQSTTFRPHRLHHLRWGKHRRRQLFADRTHLFSSLVALHSFLRLRSSERYPPANELNVTTTFQSNVDINYYYTEYSAYISTLWITTLLYEESSRRWIFAKVLFMDGSWMF